MLGTYHRTIDNKGRVFIPTKFREDFVKGIVISKGYGVRCLCLFSKENWERMDEKIVLNKVAEGETQEFSRWFYSSACEETMDQQGRIRIPQNLIEYAGLKKDIVMVGISKRAEVWAKETWPGYYEQVDSKYKENKDVFEKLGL